jgi:hypothetical protein
VLRAGTKMFGSRLLALAAGVALFSAGLAAVAEPAPAGCALLLFCSSAPPPSPVPTSGPLCPQIGSTDFNPDNHRVEPALGRPLLPRRPDGQLPLGFNDYSYFEGLTTIHQDGELLRHVGANIFRVSLGWGGVERAPGIYDWGGYDRVYCMARSFGLRPLFTVDGTPQWAAAPGADCPSLRKCLGPPAPQYAGALERFVELMTIRYPDMVAVEAWNEPNAVDHWDPPDPRAYVGELNLIYTGVKNGNPSMPVLGGGLANHQSDLPNGSIGIYNFLSAMYDDGAGPYMDAVSFHPYPIKALTSEWEMFDPTVNGVRSIVEAHDGVGQRHLWFTEVAAAAQPKPSPDSDAFSEQGQMQVLRDIYLRTEAMPDVDAILIHSLVDPPSGAPFGWVKKKDLFGRFMPKAVYCDFAARLATPINCSQGIPVS